VLIKEMMMMMMMMMAAATKPLAVSNATTFWFSELYKYTFTYGLEIAVHCDF